MEGRAKKREIGKKGGEREGSEGRWRGVREDGGE